jgi:hypothetical protein
MLSKSFKNYSLLAHWCERFEEDFQISFKDVEEMNIIFIFEFITELRHLNVSWRSLC